LIQCACKTAKETGAANKRTAAEPQPKRRKEHKMKYSYNPEEMAKEFDLEQIYRKLTSQCQSYMVRADRFFQETDGALSQMQKAVARFEKQTEATAK
jgi:hypothetical protein